MPEWFYNRPPEKANPTERVVAEHLNRLGEGWIIRWGYYYAGCQGTNDREGDFLICGPSGHILVLEVKSSKWRHFVHTGYYDFPDKDNPLNQLCDEWKAVIGRLEEANGGGKVPFVHKAFALPNLNFEQELSQDEPISRDMLLCKGDLPKFATWWRKHVASKPSICPTAECRKIFRKALCAGLKPKNISLFIKHSERLFLRFSEAEFSILSRLQRNRQLLVEGGAGTGKSFMALKMAQRLAETGEGAEVLLLCYNRILGQHLKEMVDPLKLRKGRIVAHTWEELIEWMLAQAGLELDPPEDREAVTAYYKEEVPGLVLQAMTDIPPAFDALVVDEAQDHDTVFPPALESPELPGWWHFYFHLLRGGSSAPMALFFDSAQRPAFMGSQAFAIEHLTPHLSQPAFLDLPYSLRYSRPLCTYLKTLKTPATEGLTKHLIPHPQLPEGPEVEILRDVADLAATLSEIIQRWKRTGLCPIEEIAILGPRSRLENSSLAEITTLAGCRLLNFDLRNPYGTLPYLGIHRAKGLDFLGVILIDLPPWPTILAQNDPARAQTFFLGASRARQLLAVVENKP
jgi:hypothetical protein